MWRHPCQTAARIPGIRVIANPPRVGLGHHRDKETEPDLALPPEQPARLARIADQQVHLGRAVKGGVDAHDNPPAAPVDAAFVFAPAGPFDVEVQVFGGRFDELPNRVRLAGRQHEILRLVVLQHLPHPHDVVPGKAPIAFRVQIAQFEHVQLTVPDARQRLGDLAGHELAAAQRDS